MIGVVRRIHTDEVYMPAQSEAANLGLKGGAIQYIHCTGAAASWESWHGGRRRTLTGLGMAVPALNG